MDATGSEPQSFATALAKETADSNLQVIVESMPNGVIVIDGGGVIFACNTEMEKIFGYARNELVGQKVEVLVPLASRAKHPTYREGFMSHPSKRQMGAGRDLMGLCKDGTEIPVEIGLNYLNFNGRYLGIAAIVDLRERTKIESRLKSAYDEVQQKNQEMEQFVYTVSHDLKAPLVTSMSFLGFIREDIAVGKMDDVHDSIERLEKAHLKMQELISDLLSLSRAGRMELHRVDTPIADLVAEAAEDLQQKLAEHQMQLKVETLPTLFVDGKRLLQVFENLLTNALKYASHVENPVMRIFPRFTPDETIICFQDNGPGIAPEYHKKIFGLFQRLDNKQEGTGVGLAIVARIMQLHGGRSWVESEPGQGATFCLSFPKTSSRTEHGGSRG